MISLRAPMVFLACGLAACGSAGGASTAPSPVSQTVLRAPGGSPVLSMTGVDATNVQTLAFAPDQVFRVLPNVLDSLGIPVAMLEPSKRSIGNPAFKIRQRIKGTPLSRYIDCGSSTQVG